MSFDELGSPTQQNIFKGATGSPAFACVKGNLVAEATAHLDHLARSQGLQLE